MSTNTDNLDLLMIDPATDGNDYFDVETHLNNNWEKIDAEAGVVRAQLAQNQQLAATISRGLQIITTDQDTPVWMKRILGRHDVNHALLFDSGLWTFHANVTVNSPTKVTLNATGTYQSSTIDIKVKPSQTYTFSLSMTGIGGRLYVNEYDSSDNLLYQHVTSTFTVSASASYIRVIVENTTTAGTFTFENIMLNEGSTAEGFVANLKPTQGRYIKRYGKNLLPPFGQWTLHANAKVMSAYELELNATGADNRSTIIVDVVVGQPITLSQPSADANNYYLIYDTENGVDTFLGATQSVTSVTVTPTKKQVKVQTQNLASGTYTFTNPMLNLGSTALPFEPAETKEMFISKALYGNGSVNDVVEEVDGKLMLTKRWEALSMSGAWGWEYRSDFTGSKSVALYTKIPKALGFGDNSSFLVKYNGKILKNTTDANDTNPDTFYLDGDTNLIITIPDTDHGLGEAWAGTATTVNGVSVSAQNLLKAYFNGWKYVDATTGWIGINDNAQTSNDQNYVINNYSNNYTPYHLTYQLATPQTIELVEGVDWFGSVSLHEGDNVVEMGEGAVVREPANPQVYSTNYYEINGTQSGTGSYLDNRAREILAVYKGDVVDHKWKRLSDGYTYGDQRVWIDKADFDPTAQYYVDYIAKSYQISAHADEAEVEYATNLRTVVAKNVQDIADFKQDVSDLAWGKANKFQEQWITLTKFNGWVNVDSNTEYAEYMQDEFDFMHFRGSLASGTKTNGTLIARIPAERAPKKTIWFPIINSDGTTVNVSVGLGLLLNTGEIKTYTTLAYNANVRLMIPPYIPGR